MAHPLSAVIVGAGHRALTYASYAQSHPDELRIVGVVPEHLRMMEMVFADRLGVRMHLEEDLEAPLDSRYELVIEDGQELCIRSDFGGAVPKIDDAPWPAFPPRRSTRCWIC